MSRKNIEKHQLTSLSARLVATALMVLSLFSVSSTVGIGNAALQNNSTEQARYCLAMNIYHEARSEPVEGRLAVAAVTMNRVASKHYPNTICEVVWQPRQFSWTNLSPKYHAVHEKKAWVSALEIADLFLHGARWTKVGKANHYHNTEVNPYWSDESAVVARLGNHIFYHL